MFKDLLCFRVFDLDARVYYEKLFSFEAFWLNADSFEWLMLFFLHQLLMFDARA